MSLTIALSCSCGRLSRYEFAEDPFSVDCEACGKELEYEGDDSFRLESGDEWFILNLETHEIGREGPGRIVIDAGQISRHHCTLKYVTSGYTIADEGSLNGTFVNGKKLHQGMPERLRVGDVVTLWQVELSYWGPVEEEVAPSAPPAARWASSRRSGVPTIAWSLAAIVLLGVAAIAFVKSGDGSSEPVEVTRSASSIASNSRWGPSRSEFVEDVDEEDGTMEDLEPIETSEPSGQEPEAAVVSAKSGELVGNAPAMPESDVIDVVAPEPSPVLPKAPTENRLVTLSLRVNVAGKKLDRKDSETWARLGYFLQQEAEQPYFLVFPDGTVKHIQRAGDEDAKRDRSAERGAIGDASQPAYRIRIEAETSKKNIKFYTKEIMKKFVCEMVCHLEKRQQGGKFTRVRAWKFEERMTKTVHKDMDDEALARKVYYQAIETLVTQRFGEVKMFGRAKS